MRRIRLIHSAAFFLALGVIGPVHAAQDKPEKQEEKPKPEKQQQARAPKQELPAKAPKQEQAAKPAPQQDQKSAKQTQPPGRSAEKQQNSNSANHQQPAKAQQEQATKPEKQQQAGNQQQAQHQQEGKKSGPPQRTEQATARQRAQPELRLSQRGSGRIPEERFHSNFGRDHYFSIGSPVLVGGYSRFQYGGFWFGFVEPWPSGWYYTDDVYIDYVDGGYYMYNPYYPGTRFAISVVI